MKKQTKIIIGLASVILLASLILIIVLQSSRKKEEDKFSEFEKKLSDIAVEYYEDEIEPYMAKTLSDKVGYYIVSLGDLKRAGKDVVDFENKSCDLEATSVKFNYTDGTNYELEVYLECENK